MLDQHQIDMLQGQTAYDPSGDKIGKVGQVYLDDSSGEPAWVTVNTGLFGTSESFAPLQDASFGDDRLTLQHPKGKVKDAPNVSADGHLEPEEEDELYAYYDVSTSGRHQTDGTDTRPDEGNDTSGQTSEDAMTRSEERVDVGTRTEESGRSRLRKYVVTENVTQTVPVRKEKAVLETAPITDATGGDATSGSAISEEEYEVVLSEERPVVQKVTEPVERVCLGTETVTYEETVSEEVRKEQIETDGAIERR